MKTLIFLLLILVYSQNSIAQIEMGNQFYYENAKGFWVKPKFDSKDTTVVNKINKVDTTFYPEAYIISVDNLGYIRALKYNKVTVIKTLHYINNKLAIKYEVYVFNKRFKSKIIDVRETL